MLCVATQERWVMVKRSDRTCLTGDGNGKPLQYSCLENPNEQYDKGKRKTVKNELPRLVGAQYASGNQWRHNSRKNEGLEPKQRHTQLWMGLVIEGRFDAVESNIA